MTAPRTAVSRVLDAATWLTTPLLPDDYLGLVNPLWSTRELRGRVLAVQAETADAVTLLIRPGRGWVSHRAGQYVRVGVDIDGVRHWRSYSLSSPPERPDACITITVKVAPHGLVSGHLARRVAPGSIVRLAPAQGTFVLPVQVPPRLLFLTAGSGITPVAAMLRSLVARAAVPDVVLIHSAPTGPDMIFGSELRAMAGRLDGLRLYERHTRTNGQGQGQGQGPGQGQGQGPGQGQGQGRGRRAAGRVTADRLAGICPDWAQRETWVCGPAQMIDDAERHWRRAGIADRLHVERFGPAAARGGGNQRGAPGGARGGIPGGAQGGGFGGRVQFVRSGRAARAAGGTPLLLVGESAGVLMPSGCRMGICHTCVARLASGRVRDLRTGEEHGDEGELIQTCVSAAAGDVEIEL